MWVLLGDIMAKLIKQTFVKIRQENLQMYEMNDGSYIVAFSSDANPNPELLVGCIGQWVNTDDLEFADMCFHGIEAAQEEALLLPKCDVLDCTCWRESLYGTCL
jgi:hypothetical protein